MHPEWTTMENERSVHFEQLLKGRFPLTRYFHVLTRVKFTCVYEVQEMYEKAAWKRKVEQGSSLTFTRRLPYIALYYLRALNLRASARKNYATLEIHLKARFSRQEWCWSTIGFRPRTQKLEATVHTKIILDRALDALRVCFQISSGSAHKTGLQDGRGLWWKKSL